MLAHSALDIFTVDNPHRIKNVKLVVFAVASLAHELYITAPSFTYNSPFSLTLILAHFN